MKHLKTYKIFESTFNDSQIREYLNDVFLELTDDGYKVDIEGMFMLRNLHEVNEEQTGYKINIKGGLSKISDIILPLDHVIGYLSDTFGRYWIDVYFKPPVISGFNFTRFNSITELENYEKHNSPDLGFVKNTFVEIVINFRKKS
jgi:hypothetical protein